MTSFTFADPIERLETAEQRREEITLSPADIRDLLDDIPTEDAVMETWIEKLGKVDTKALKISKRAQQAIAEALGLDAEDIWK